MYSLKTVVVVSISTALLTAACIYLTPLKWVTVLEPHINDIDPTTFNEDFTMHPEKYVFIDVRPEAMYNTAHAKGSINMPLHTLYDTRHTLPKKGKTIVLICSGGRASGVGYHYLQHFGFFNINRIEGGIEKWIVDGLPIEGSGVQTMSTVYGPTLAYERISCES